MPLNYARLYGAFMKAHALLPYTFARGYAFPPLRISLMVTYKCNLGCKMCFQREWHRQHKDQEELGFDEIVQVIEQTPRFTLLTWSGGEPFVRPDMVDILRYAARRNPCNLLTNATLLDEEAIKTIVESGIRVVGISVDGAGKVHDAIRGRQGCFEKTVTAIRQLQDYKLKSRRRFPLLDIKAMILPDNLSELPEILNLAVRLEADFLTLSLPFGDLQFAPCAQQDLAALIKPVRIEAEIDEDFLRRQLRHVYNSRPPLHLRFYPAVDIDEAVRYYRNQVDLCRYRPCSFPWSHAWISPTGQVFPCLSYEIGNIRTATLRQLWNHERFRAFRQEIKRRGLVPSCVGCCYMEQKGDNLYRDLECPTTVRRTNSRKRESKNEVPFDISGLENE